MNLDLFRLLVFVTVVDRGGYSAAARQLNLTQSTVSHHVSELERACGAEWCATGTGRCTSPRLAMRCTGLR